MARAETLTVKPGRGSAENEIAPLYEVDGTPKSEDRLVILPLPKEMKTERFLALRVEATLGATYLIKTERASDPPKRWCRDSLNAIWDRSQMVETLGSIYDSPATVPHR